MKPETSTTLSHIRQSLPPVQRFAWVVAFVCLAGIPVSRAQTPARWKSHDMNRPRPPVVTASPTLPAAAPSDALVLFDGGDLSKWRSQDGGPAKWIVKDGYMESVAGSGYLFTRDSFGDIQLHVEWAAPVPAEGKGQGRGNSGVYLMGMYEVQVLDSYDNITYADGQAAAAYGQYPPLVNASRPPGEWQSYDLVFRRPRFSPDGNLLKPARLTLFHNGVLTQDNVKLWGPTSWLQHLPYRSHPDRLPLALQDHGNPVRYRNIWLRELPEWSRPGPTSDDTKPLITLAPEVLDLYTGEYKAEPVGSVVIRREGSQLYAEILDLPKLELVTHSTKEFSLRWTAARMVFALNSDGAPTGFTFYIGGDEIQAKKAD